MPRTADLSEGQGVGWSARLPRETARTFVRLWRRLTKQLLGQSGVNDGDGQSGG